MNAEHENPVAELESIYKEANARAKEDPAIMNEARSELVKLQAGDPENVSMGGC